MAFCAAVRRCALTLNHVDSGKVSHRRYVPIGMCVGCDEGKLTSYSCSGQERACIKKEPVSRKCARLLTVDKSGLWAQSTLRMTGFYFYFYLLTRPPVSSQTVVGVIQLELLQRSRQWPPLAMTPVFVSSLYPNLG